MESSLRNPIRRQSPSTAMYCKVLLKIKYNDVFELCRLLGLRKLDFDYYPETLANRGVEITERLAAKPPTEHRSTRSMVKYRSLAFPPCGEHFVFL